MRQVGRVAQALVVPHVTDYELNLFRAVRF